jgi:hypothetical protein
MKREEYDELIADPVRFLYETWLPRVSTEFSAKRAAVTSYRNNLSFVKGGMAMLDYFNAFGPQVERMRRECGTVSAICGMLKAPLDILADKLRGYVGAGLRPDGDSREGPAGLRGADAAPGLSGADRRRPVAQVPIPIWMHRGCTPFISSEHFETIYWPTLKPIVEALWAQGNQTLFYAEGKWDAHLERFAELPAGSIVYHIDRTTTRRWRTHPGQEVLPERRRAEYAAGLRKPDEVKAHLPQADRDHRRRGRLHHGRQRHHAERRTHRESEAMTDATREYGRTARRRRSPISIDCCRRKASRFCWSCFSPS